MLAHVLNFFLFICSLHHAQRQAEEQGFQQVLWLFGPDHQITEVGAMNLFVVLQDKDGSEYLTKFQLLRDDLCNSIFILCNSICNSTNSILDFSPLPSHLPCPLEGVELATAPLNGLILPGIVRDSILTLAREWGKFKVSERTITMPEIVKAWKEQRVSHFQLILAPLSFFDCCFSFLSLLKAGILRCLAPF